MKLAITGTPGTGKTTIAKALAKKLKASYLNEREFCKRRKIGKIEGKEKELVVPLKRLETELNKWLSKQESAVIEGHLLCETRAKVDFVFVLECDIKELYKRLKKRKYSEEKILDNLFCEKTGYCKKSALKTYPKNRVFAIKGIGIKKTTAKIIQETGRKKNRQKVGK